MNLLPPPLFSIKKNRIFRVVLLAGSVLIFTGALSQENKAGQAETVPLYRIPPDYPVPYRIPAKEDIHTLMLRIARYLDAGTPMELVDRTTGRLIGDHSVPVENAKIRKGDFFMVSYEWGVTYAGMLALGEVTGDNTFTDYTRERFRFVNQLANTYRPLIGENKEYSSPVHSVLQPHTLDDAGSMCAAMIKSSLADVNNDLKLLIENYIQFIINDEYRLSDGTFARRGLHPNTIWLDDMFMSVPALAQMGKFTGERKYFDDAARQVVQMSERMFNTHYGLYMHTWSEAMKVHPEFRWARANGWAIMAMVELLEVLPADHPQRDAVLGYLRAHIEGISKVQSGSGFWHQVLDRPDSYLESSATAIFTYAIARAINRGYVEASAYGPMVILAWNALTTRINEKGQITGTCVGTGMGFDYAFYYYRPQSPLAAHAYGPTLLAGAEIIRLMENFTLRSDHLSIQFYNKE
jgi:rhamnogalacturonyl hydrolase YesR